RCSEQCARFVGHPYQLYPQALPVAEARRGEGLGVVGCWIKVRGEHALQGKITREQGRVTLQTRRALLQQTLKDLTRGAQLPIQGAGGVAPDHQLCESQRRDEHPQNQRREGEKDLAAQAGTTPAHGSPRIPCIAGRGRAGASGRLKVTSLRSRSTRPDCAVASRLRLLTSCQPTSVYSPADSISCPNH